MGFVKLDCGILNSTVWIDLPLRNIFITALLMAEPRNYKDPVPQIAVDSLEPTGWVAPAGWYGYIGAAGIGIVNRASMEKSVGMECLRVLGSPEIESRSQEFEGRRLIRIDGGYLVLNYQRYRDHDYSAAERMREMRARRKDQALRNGGTVRQNITQAEAEAEAEAEEPKPPNPLGPAVLKSPSAKKPESANVSQRKPEYGIDSYMAATAFGQLAGFNGNQNLYIAKQAMETWKRRNLDRSFADAPSAVLKLWREYDGLVQHGKVSMKTFLGELGRFVDSDSWKPKPKEEKPAKGNTGFKPARKTPDWANQ